MSDLATFLATLDASDLAALLADQPDVTRGAPVVDLDDLAERLQYPSHVLTMLIRVDAATLALVETVAALGDAATLDRVAGLLGTTAHDGLFLRALGRATGASLVFPHPGLDRIGTNRGVREVVVSPLGLGSTLREVLAGVPANELKKVVRRYGGEVPTRKADLVDAVATHLSDPATVRRVFADAPADVLASIERVIAGERSHAEELGLARRLSDDPWDAAHLADALAQPSLASHFRAAQWAVDAGLAFGTTRASIELPAEVRYALLGPDVRVPFVPDEPAIATAPVSVEQSESAASAELTATMASVTATLEAVDRLAVKQLKSGGVGAREVTRVAKVLGLPAADVRFALGLGIVARLLGGDGDRLVASDGLASWRSLDPPQRALVLLVGWIGVPALLSRERSDDGKALAVGDWPDGEAPGLRVALLRRARDASGEGQGVVDVAAVAANLSWWFPLLARRDDTARMLWAEAERLGVVALGRITDLGRGLFGEQLDPQGAHEELHGLDEDDVLEADDDSPGPEVPVSVLTRMLPASTSSVVIGSDLTVIVAGTPSATVVDLLDVVARRESHGAASMWRLSPESVRSALDAGFTGPMLTERLAKMAGGRLPQPVHYLLDDVARRHGHLRVRPAQAVIVCEDEALLAEVVAERAVRVLELRLVARTVAVAQADPDHVLERLRAIGHMPADVDADGVVRLHGGPFVDPKAFEPADDRLVGQLDETPTRAEMAAEVRAWAEENLLVEMFGHPGGPQPIVPETREELAARLLAGGLPPTDSGTEEIVAAIARHARRLSDGEVRQVAQALQDGSSLQIRYRGQSGRVSDRIVSDLVLQNHLLVGWCHLRDDERMFALERIERVGVVE